MFNLLSYCSEPNEVLTGKALPNDSSSFFQTSTIHKLNANLKNFNFKLLLQQTSSKKQITDEERIKRLEGEIVRIKDEVNHYNNRLISKFELKNYKRMTYLFDL